MSSTDFIHQRLKKDKKWVIGFETRPESKELFFTQEEHTHLSYNIQDNLHYFGTAADNDSISKQVCLFHPYHPDLNCVPKTVGFPETPIAFECPSQYSENLPIEIKHLLSEHKVAPDKIHIRMFIQNMPWHRGVALLMRPQHCVFNPTTEEAKNNFITGKFNGSCICRMGIFNSGETITIDNTPPNTLSNVMGFTSHPSGSGYTLCSPSNGIIHGINYDKTYSFYNVVVTGASITADSEWYISPMCLLNWEDFQRIISVILCGDINSVEDIVKILHIEKFTIGAMLARLLNIQLS